MVIHIPKFARQHPALQPQVLYEAKLEIRMKTTIFISFV